MPSVGPSLPPAQAEKRKRDDEAGDDKTSQSSQSSSSVPVSPSSSSSAKRPRTIGPTLPPPSLDERPSHPLESDAASSSDDDDFGPSLPTASLPKASVSNDELSTVSTAGLQKAAPATTQRDEWMIVPPSSDDWSSRVDPTKLKNRKFNTGKGSKGPGQTVGKESNVNWTETLDEKRARLQREMMGIKDTSISTAKDSPPDHAKARESARKLREYNVSITPQMSLPLPQSELTGSRRSREAQHFTRSTKRPIRRRKKTTQVQGLLIGRRTLLGA